MPKHSSVGAVLGEGGARFGDGWRWRCERRAAVVVAAAVVACSPFQRQVARLLVAAGGGSKSITVMAAGGAGVLGGAQKGAADTARPLQISWRRLHIDDVPRWHMTPSGTAELPQYSTFLQCSEAR